MTPLDLADELDKKIKDACIFPYEVVLKQNDASRLSYALRCLQEQKQRLETELSKCTQFNTQLHPLTDEDLDEIMVKVEAKLDKEGCHILYCCGAIRVLADAILRKASEK